MIVLEPEFQFGIFTVGDNNVFINILSTKIYLEFYLEPDKIK